MPRVICNCIMVTFHHSHGVLSEQPLTYDFMISNFKNMRAPLLLLLISARVCVRVGVIILYYCMCAAYLLPFPFL